MMVHQFYEVQTKTETQQPINYKKRLTISDYLFNRAKSDTSNMKNERN